MDRNNILLKQGVKLDKLKEFQEQIVSSDDRKKAKSAIYGAKKYFLSLKILYLLFLAICFLVAGAIVTDGFMTIDFDRNFPSMAYCDIKIHSKTDSILTEKEPSGFKKEPYSQNPMHHVHEPLLQAVLPNLLFDVGTVGPHATYGHW